LKAIDSHAEDFTKEHRAAAPPSVHFRIPFGWPAPAFRAVPCLGTTKAGPPGANVNSTRTRED